MAKVCEMAGNAVADASEQLSELLGKLPKNFDVTIGDEAVTIREDWFRWGNALLFVLLTVVVFSCLPFVQEIAYLAPSIETRFVGIGLAVVVVLALFYCVLVGVLNASVIRVQGDRLTRQIGPLPWPGGFSLRRSDIPQLFAVHQARLQHRDSPWDWDGDSTSDQSLFSSMFRKYKTVSFYKLVVGTADRKRKYVVSNEYSSTFVPHTLGCVLEALLQIDDCFVAGEVRNAR